MTKKFSWEVDKTSLVLRVEDGDRKTEWKIRKSTNHETLYQIFGELQVAVDDHEYTAHLTPVHDAVIRGTDAQDRWEAFTEPVRQAQTEEESMAALAALAASKSVNAKWWDNDDEESAFVAMLPDYDSGEI